MKAIMKTSIERDYSRAWFGEYKKGLLTDGCTGVVVSSCNIPTIPLTVAQTMNPPPRPPSPTARAAAQRATRRANPNKLSTRDAQVLMGIPSPDMPPPSYAVANGGERPRLKSLSSNSTLGSNPTSANPPSGVNPQTLPPFVPVPTALPPFVPTPAILTPPRQAAVPESEPVSHRMQAVSRDIL
jgi:hypothetical protein